MKPWWRDALERIFWTLVAAVLAFATVHVADLPDGWLIPAVAILTAVKTIVAKYIPAGGKDTAAIG
jgi:hypothetical protein